MEDGNWNALWNWSSGAGCLFYPRHPDPHHSVRLPLSDAGRIQDAAHRVWGSMKTTSIPATGVLRSQGWQAACLIEMWPSSSWFTAECIFLLYILLGQLTAIWSRAEFTLISPSNLRTLYHDRSQHNYSIIYVAPPALLALNSMHLQLSVTVA